LHFGTRVYRNTESDWCCWSLSGQHYRLSRYRERQSSRCNLPRPPQPDQSGRGTGFRRDRRSDLADSLRDAGQSRRQQDCAGESDLRGSAEGNHRPLALHVERELLLQRSGAQGFPVELRTARRADRIRADSHRSAWRDDLPVVSDVVPESRGQGVDVRDAGGEAGTVSGGADRIIVSAGTGPPRRSYSLPLSAESAVRELSVRG